MNIWSRAARALKYYISNKKTLKTNSHLGLASQSSKIMNYYKEFNWKSMNIWALLARYLI